MTSIDNYTDTNSLETILSRWLCDANDISEVFVVGGAIRDHILNRPVSDMDIVCKNAGNNAKKIAASRPFATTIIRLEKKPHAPCFRIINKTDTKDFIDVVEINGDSIEHDLCQRDFTINAMAIKVSSDCRTGDIIDPKNGKSDINLRIIRCCSQDTFINDPLRMLRAARFAAMLDFAIEPESEKLMAEHAKKINQSAFERITKELFLLFETPNSFSQIMQIDRLEVLENIFPEILPAKGCEQNSFHNEDVWEHCLAVMEKCEKIINEIDQLFPESAEKISLLINTKDAKSVLKLAALLHDVGKPASRKFDDRKQRNVFYRHDKTGASIAEQIADRMKLSRKQKNLLVVLISNHMRPAALSQKGVKKNTLIKWLRELGDSSILVLLLAAADSMAKQGEKSSKQEKELLIQWIAETLHQYLESIKQQLSAPDLITGNDLIKLGIEPGPVVGKFLETIRGMQDQGIVCSKEEALSAASKLDADHKISGF